MAIVATTVRVRKNGVNAGPQIEIINPQTGQFEDAVNTASFVASDEINYSNTTGGTAGAVVFAHMSCMMENTEVTGRFVSLGGHFKKDARVVLIG